MHVKSAELVVALLGAVLALLHTALLFTGEAGAAEWVQMLLSWGFVAALSQRQSRPAVASALMVGLNVVWSVLWLIAPANLGYTFWVVLVPLAVYTARRNAGSGVKAKPGMRFAAVLTAAAAAWCVISPFMWTWDERLVLFYRRPVDAALMLALHWAVIAVAYLVAANGAADEEAKENKARMREERLAAARKEERLNTARDIHDVLGHSLTLIKVQANAGLATGTERESLELIRDTAGDALTDIRLLVKGLRDEGPGLAPAATADELSTVIERFRDSGMDVALDAPKHFSMPTVTAQAANRIVAEALTNAVKHQENPVARVTVEQGSERIVVTVASTGRAAPQPGAGTGIVGMRERACATGGSLDITQEKNTVTITATLGA